jgi:sirohydrochlorin ferrochelatase
LKTLPKQEQDLNVLLLIAHGSRKEAANQEIRDLAARIEKHDASDYAAVVPTFLEFAQPDIGRAIDHCVDSGAKQITVLPYFLSAGAHVNRDVPGQLEIASQRHPGVNINLTPHFGFAEGIVDLVIDCTSGAPD